MSNQSLTTLSYQSQINDNFESHDKFVNKIKNYVYNLGFTIRLGKFKYYNKSENEEKTVRKRILLCSQADLTYNHLMVKKNHRFFISNERNISDDVKQQIELLCQADVDVPTIHTILKEEFGDHVT
ncbi:21084_t:CDS:2 [Cetraspora pellucida]|uniref:21084_t:CDS:1 n=1 Tax=Cetraspora pellucida TaxID=1433469 RepID=A0A9N9NEW0_9GLOM|nr:21084_t:CDS:2 [Cetraspora pellucida]